MKGNPMSQTAKIAAIEYHLPARILTSKEIAGLPGSWPEERIVNRLGISERHIAEPEECSSDLALVAAQKLFATGKCKADEVDFLILCTQTPDYFLPTTACILQRQLRLPNSTGALDVNLGCSGFVYGLGLAAGLIASGQAKCVLLFTAETYSKLIAPGDVAALALFGDGAAATCVRAETSGTGSIGPFVYGTDGTGATNLIVPSGGFRNPLFPRTPAERSIHQVSSACPERLRMNGQALVDFILREVPGCVETLLARAGLTRDEIGLYVFHQANATIVGELRRALGLPPERVQVTLEHCGNTVSSTIPIALKHAVSEGRLRAGDYVVVAGFGVGYSWAAALVTWSEGL